MDLWVVKDAIGRFSPGCSGNPAALALRANRAERMDQFDRYLRLGLKAQSQCRATLETLATIKNPQPVAFVRQANIAQGPQQVNNNGDDASGRASRGRGGNRKCAKQTIRGQQ